MTARRLTSPAPASCSKNSPSNLRANGRSSHSTQDSTNSTPGILIASRPWARGRFKSSRIAQKRMRLETERALFVTEGRASRDIYSKLTLKCLWEAIKRGKRVWKLFEESTRLAADSWGIRAVTERKVTDEQVVCPVPPHASIWILGRREQLKQATKHELCTALYFWGYTCWQLGRPILRCQWTKLSIYAVTVKCHP
jgi:hypothetical protein